MEEHLISAGSAEVSELTANRTPIDILSLVLSLVSARLRVVFYGFPYTDRPFHQAKKIPKFNSWIFFLMLSESEGS